jgi:hypothetical protein
MFVTLLAALLLPSCHASDSFSPASKVAFDHTAALTTAHSDQARFDVVPEGRGLVVREFGIHLNYPGQRSDFLEMAIDWQGTGHLRGGLPDGLFVIPLVPKLALQRRRRRLLLRGW